MSKRLQGYKWLLIRNRILRRDPLCLRCKARGIVTASCEVDHVVPLHKGGTDADSNLQGLCHDCHTDKTNEDMGKRVKPRIGADGWPSNRQEAVVPGLITHQDGAGGGFESLAPDA